MSDDVDVGGGGADHDPGALDSSDVGLIAGIIAAQAVTSCDTTERKAEPYVEPDYAVVWGRRWRVIRVVLLVSAVALIAYMFMRGGSGPN